ncbi:transcriptional regulator, TetR family [Duganella sp. CF517]|uniref:TetR/AcrR family transcriptional regulator n=1 Tax=Duganella sp. CF517 TaxID=1881038 RepID=UPI0008AF8553|nr:TetR family transcriptional regulator [Duganella sp. CF517]SEO08940.1 transcriptional regulator, TetR family [Duganella sp. CF517]
MDKLTHTTARRRQSLTREQIIEASIALLDAGGEGGLTFRALAERLGTGAGAIYWHVDDKGDLLTAACDALVARALGAPAPGQAPGDVVRAVALALFDAIDAHPWVGAALTAAPGSLPVVRILERLGRQVGALGVPAHAQWASVSALLSYILGVAGQNAANARLALPAGADRTAFLDAVADGWLALDADEFAFTRGVAGRLREHDDRLDFLAGIDLILAGIAAAAAAR